MDDELEDLYFFELFQSGMKVLSRISLTNPFSGSAIYLNYFWRMIKIYLFKPEMLLATFILIIFLFFLHSADEWGRNFMANLKSGFGLKRATAGGLRISTSTAAERESWEKRTDAAAVYAVMGRRPSMEDRFVLEQINGTDVNFFAIFDGHGGQMAAEFAKEILVQNLQNKIIEISNIMSGKPMDVPKTEEKNEEKCEPLTPTTPDKDVKSDLFKEIPPASPATPSLSASQRRKSFKKSLSKDDEVAGGANKDSSNQISDPEILSKFKITRENMFSTNKNVKATPKPKQYEAKCYIEGDKINFGKLLTDEVIAADYALVEKAKKSTNIAGTTALIAILHRNKLTVANVGDSRGVMADHKGAAIPLSFDHKPQQVREHKRIHDAGGFIAFRGVWRVAGILATSRALGDYPLKDRNLIIPDPDILTFDLEYNKPQFMILASDGLWDVFQNEEAVAYIKEHLNEPHFGAKSICLEAYTRGSLDNISVMVIKFNHGRYEIGTS
ncbi:protein phosphatase 1L [Culicoides brevitarsis]|uniref:protein phosphatase 1L n=1 Tax=Culicoides brevitarsis TaxID=469753 RepID=UPI00307C0FE0